jgi:naphthoate synthase/2-ketocyclohexanecarboxyl-CoA hydrolase
VTGYTDLIYAEEGGIGAITLNRPEVHNAFREQTIHELIAAFDQADASPAVGVIVFTGAGQEAFSTGGDVAMEDEFTPDEGRRMARLLIRLTEAMRGTGKPTIAKIRGWCVGGGNELNLMCDLSVAAESARFAHTDARLGNSPIWFGTQLMARLVGEKLAKEIIMLGEVYSAADAARMGWINRAVPDDQLDDFVSGWARRLLGHSPQSLRLTKTSINADTDPVLASVRQSFEALSYVYGTPEFHEGTAAFLEKRRPRFRPESG